MEADDRRPNPRAFALMVDAPRANGWDGCCSDARPFGATGRMRAYCDWQNSLTRPAELASNRFVEIPALHQTGLFTREAVDAVLDLVIWWLTWASGASLPLPPCSLWEQWRLLPRPTPSPDPDIFTAIGRSSINTWRRQVPKTSPAESLHKPGHKFAT